MTDTLLPAIVQSVADALAAPVTALLAELGPERLLNARDRVVAHSVLEGARLAFERALSDASGPGPDATRYDVHSALGRLSFVRRDGAGLGPEALAHGCTMSVREQCAFFLAQGTANEAREGILKFRASAPSESTIKRVATRDGRGMMRVWDQHAEALVREAIAPVAEQVEVISTSADGAQVPMRGTGQGDSSREWHEARVVTVTLFGAPDPARAREVTLHTLAGAPYRACVGDLRPRLGTFVFGEMPHGHGPKGERAKAALRTVVATVRSMARGAKVRAVCDGGAWPEGVLDAVCSPQARTCDLYHATEHLHDAAVAAFGEGEMGTQWYRRERTELLTELGAALALVATIEALSRRTKLRASARARLRTEAGFFRKRARQMNYAARLRADEPIGSGIVEAAIKGLVTLRMKRPGACWGEDGGDAVMALRSLRLSGLWDRAWCAHADAEAADHTRAAA